MKEGWEYKKIKDIADVFAGQGAPQGDSNYCLNGIPFIKAGNLSELINGKPECSIQNVSEQIAKSHKLKLYKAGSVIFAKSGMSCMKGFIYTLKNDCYVVSHLAIISPTAVNSYYLNYYLCFFKPYTLVNDAAYPTISLKDIENLKIPIPPLSEQQSIVDYLDAAFAKIDAMKANAEKSLNEAKALFQASLKEMLEPKEGWEDKYLKDIAQYSIGLTYKPTNVCDDGTIVLRSSNIQEGKLDLNDIVRVNAYIKEELYVRCGDILMCSRNGSAQLVGKVCIIPELKEKMTYGTFMMVIRSAYNPLLYHYFDTGLFRSQIKHGEANMINQITRYMLDEVKLNIPPLSEQQSIVEPLDSLKSKVDRLQENYDKISQECDALKQAILRQVFE